MTDAERKELDATLKAMRQDIAELRRMVSELRDAQPKPAPKWYESKLVQVDR